MKRNATWSLMVALLGHIWIVACASQPDSSPSGAESEVEANPTQAMKAKNPLRVAKDSATPAAAAPSEAAPAAPLPPEAQAASPAAAPAPAAADGPPCVGIGPAVKIPYFVQKPPVMLTNFLKTCTTPAGEPGFVKGSAWTALGFPCTAGRGRIDKRGSENTPNLIHFMLQTSCPMEPSVSAEAEKVVRQKLRMPEDSHLIAYYPFSVQYWEFDQFPERDTGFSPTLYSERGINQGWQRFVNKNEAIRVRLYGRENAWERGKELFEVEALLQPEGRSLFRLNVVQAKAMTAEEKQAVLQRCDEIKPKRNCGEIFAD